MGYGRVEDGFELGWRWVTDGLEMDYGRVGDGLDKKSTCTQRLKYLYETCVFVGCVSTRDPRKLKFQKRQRKNLGKSSHLQQLTQDSETVVCRNVILGTYMVFFFRSQGAVRYLVCTIGDFRQLSCGQVAL